MTRLNGPCRLRFCLVGVLVFVHEATTLAQEAPPPPPPPGDHKPAKSQAPAGWFDLTGFWEVRGGVRTQNDRYEKDASLGETRLQLDWEKHWKTLSFRIVSDFIYDPVLDHHSVNIETGQGWIDLRQANVLLSPTEFMDVKTGRQILTWGTGDLLFINDLFPKDWQAFFIGRDVEYLKAPSDAIKISFFTDLANMDVVFTPRFDSDRFIRGRRLSYYNSMLARRAGRDAVIDARRDDEWFDDSEWAARVFRNVGGYELAAYGYWGYWKSPGGTDTASGKAIFPRLSVYGASTRGKIGRGIGNVEIGYYDSRQDRGGDNPFVKNSEFRFLLGYEQELSQISRDLTMGLQYYMEWMTDYDDYLRMLPGGAKADDERRHVLTLRITKMLMNQNLILSFFTYYSPSDSDTYIRPLITYKIDDHWTAELGGNVFVGKYHHTFFGQFERNSNVYAALRYAF
ncbi:MAG: hypothetical protein SVV80_09550 [Planctomycetota bacterium]|nr:hypothetical protein [Planctomycetota bacterium]